MAAIKKWAPGVAVLASILFVGCATATGAGEEDQGSYGLGGGTSGPECKPESGCSSCTGCIAQCICATGDKVGCVESCGPPGGSPPPDPNQGGGGTPGGPPPEGGGGSGGGWDPGGGGGNVGGNGGGGNVGGNGGTSGGGGNGGTSGGGGSGGGPVGGNCTYPPGPYGTSVGSVPNPSLSWQGYFEGAATATTIKIEDYFDCDGTRGIHAVFLAQSAVWCGACQEEAQDLNNVMAGGWTQKGIRVLTLLIEDNSGNPAQLKHAEAWKNTFKAKSWSVVADPAFTFKNSGSNGLPLGIIIDPRTMKIVKKMSGYSPSNPTLVNLAAQNAK
ncbi:MAG: hypothetical protein IPI67_29790 [Myxococcales bacterium]|nr:hypothetical protein [Myxococcales bacterium]